MENRCDSCLWTGQCYTEGFCEHFTPLDEELIDDAIESGRYLHRKEWFELLEELEEVEALWPNS